LGVLPFFRERNAFSYGVYVEAAAAAAGAGVFTAGVLFFMDTVGVLAAGGVLIDSPDLVSDVIGEIGSGIYADAIVSAPLST
jgi:hypothetical protein